ncbi:MAG: sn-glycerol-3-phosphate ABC transporter ATP-binding protein UgpC [Actinobacteria bacterium]|nr:MAG: sn-glycerol-3-phosphate ABC transporter ATP-binding protein UgpC [Actinomycetota bacterium]TML24451.1 MAG: sn-glycerol-3-phosphate ABC transporter ATP-binding protein UgpC [Actinomycetota bacterium]
MADVQFRDVDKVYDNGVQAVFSLSLQIQDGEFLVLVGPSGCGKTTALRMVAGLEEITDGTISIGDRVVNDLTPKDRDIAMVFQNYALYPHLSVGDNIAFGLRLRKTPKKTVDERVQWAARLLGLTPYLDRRPKELSGGQRQRVAMGRAIVRQPQVFLMDEPLSNLDAKLRVQMRAEIGRIQRELKTTTIYVTHDQTEAMTMGDHVAVMRKGELQQMDTPQKLYSDPKNLFVASFIGSPSMNLVEAEIERRNGGLVAKLADQELAIPAEVASLRPALAGYAGRKVALGIRPEQLEDASIVRDGADGNRLRGRVLLTEALGSELLAHVELSGRPVVTDDVLEGAVELEDAMLDDLAQKAEEERTTFVGRFDAESEVRPDHIVDMLVDTGKLQFFDLETGTSIRAG